MAFRRKLLRKGENKYGNKPVEIDGIKFPSKREGERYLYLKSLQEQGIIKDLSVHDKFELIQKVFHYEEVQLKTKTKLVKRTDQLPITYELDFSYTRTEDYITIYEDVKMSKNKRFIPKEFVLKAKLMYWKYGVKIRLVTKANESIYEQESNKVSTKKRRKNKGSN